MKQINDYLAVCQEAARKAGALLLDKLGRVAVREKAPTDLVTEADFASQEIVRSTVLGAFPDHGLIGEEDPKGMARPDCEFRWIVDPLDGTTNYVHQYPFFAVSLALEQRGELLVGTVFDPIRQECFTAARGQGAFLNGNPLRVSRVEQLDHAMAAVGLPYNTQRNSPDLLVMIEASIACQSIRRTGSASLNLAYVAAGRADVFWSFSTKVWDIAAGALLVREAGGVVSGPTGQPVMLDSGQFLATATQPLHERFVALINGAVDGKCG
jgi:myo-inositol-1(or 4)-monophosphatase